MPIMTLSEELTWRGFVNQTTFKDITAIDKEPLTFYWGVDPSADSMHIGQLAMAMMIRHFIDHGHKAILLVGGATGMIGDPDGKSHERELKTADEVELNKAGIAAQYDRLFAGKAFERVDNFDWFKDIGYLDFLRNIGKHFSITQMLDRQFVQDRIGKDGPGISYAEFSYSLIQGYDFLYLNREKGATLQVCGSDQWGNSISGVNLIRKLQGTEAHIWSAPLIINKLTGKKFGKSETGTIWLDESKTSPYQMFQFWLNVDDEGVIGYLKIYTLLSKDVIEALEREHNQNPEQRIAQKRLAKEITTLVHGNEKTVLVQSAVETLFGGGDATTMPESELKLLAHELPVVKEGDLIDVLIEAGVASSNGEARRLIEGKAISVNGTKIDHSLKVIAPSLIKKGKNTFILVK